MGSFYELKTFLLGKPTWDSA